jgi:hypothetical protein
VAGPARGARSGVRADGIGRSARLRDEGSFDGVMKSPGAYEACDSASAPAGAEQVFLLSLGGPTGSRFASIARLDPVSNPTRAPGHGLHPVSRSLEVQTGTSVSEP